MPRRDRCAGLLALALLALTPAAAEAGTVTRVVQPRFEGPTPVADVVYLYRAAPRQANRVAVHEVGSGGAGVAIRDSAAGITAATPDCAAVEANEVRCLAPSAISGRRRRHVTVLVETLDRADRLRVGPGVTGSGDLGSGNDRALAADGGVTIYGRSGRDRLRSGPGADLLDGGRGADRIDAGAGDDTIRGRAGNDRLFGGAGADRIDDGSGADRVFGDAGPDRIGSQGDRRGLQDVSCGRGRDVVLDPNRFVNVGRDCELAETSRGDRLVARPLRVQDGALVFLAGCTKQGCKASGRAGAAVSVRLGGRLLGRRRYRVGVLGSVSVRVQLSENEVDLLRAPDGRSLSIRAAGMAYRVLIRVR